MIKSIRTKLLLIFLLIGVLSIAATGVLFYLETSSTLTRTRFNHLTSIRETKKSQIETYFDQVRNQIITFSEDKMIIDAMKQFKTAFHSIKKNNVFANTQILSYASTVSGYYENEYHTRLNSNVQDKREIEQYLPDDDRAIILQYHYIANNPNPTGSKDILEMAADGSQYSHIHSQYHPVIRDYRKRFGYYDIFLVDVETGHIIYSVFKEVDYATSLLTGPYKNTNFARVFRDARNASNQQFTKLVDFEFYDPSYAEPASFIASPIYDGDKKIGVLVFQVPMDEINRVMTGNYNWKNEGLGESGETYIAGSDYRMRNDSRFVIEEPDRYFELLENIGTGKEIINMMKLHSTSILFQEIRTEAVEDALNGNADTKIIDDYRGVPVLSSYVPLSIEDVNWVILSEIDKKEALSALDVIRNKIIFITLIISPLIVFIVYLISKNITKPILQLVKSTDNVSKGNLSKRVDITREDEIGKLATSFNKMTDSLVEANANKEHALTESKKARDYSENLIEVARDAIVGIDESEIVNVWNRAAENIFGYSKEEILGQQVTTIIPERYKQQHKDGLERFVETGESRIMNSTVEVAGITKKGIEVPIEMSIAFQKNEEGIYSFMAIIRDITERKRSEKRLNAQHVITQILSVSTTPKEAYHKILPAVCNALYWEFGAIWVYNSQDDVLCCSDLWHVPIIGISEFKEKTRKSSFSCGIGLPGRVWKSSKPAWIIDVVKDSNFPRASVALKAGLHGAFGFPIIIDKEILGVIEFFSQKPQEPDEELLNMMSAVGNQIALFIKRNQAEGESYKLSRAVEQSPAMVIITEPRGNIEYVNPKFTEVTGYTSQEVIGQNLRVLKSGFAGSKEYKRLWNTINSGDDWTGEVHNKKKDGQAYWVSSSISSVKDKKGIITHFIGIEEDITARKGLEQLQRNTMEEREKTIKNLKNLMDFSVIMREETQESELIKHMARALKKEFTPDIIAVLMLNRENNLREVPLIEPQMPVEKLIKPETFIDHSKCQVLRTGHELIVRDINEDIPCECLSLKIKEGGYACYPLITGVVTTGAVLLVKKEVGYWNSDEKRSLFSTYVGMVASAVHGVRLMEMTRHAAITDGLTGVYNRRFFDETLDKQILLAKRQKKPLCLLIMDIDHFKNFNDTYGHITGDSVLKRLTKSLNNSIRESDILARYGGEEFVIIMPDASLPDALGKADEVRQNIESMDLDNLVSGQTLHMTISIGVASFPEHGTEPDALVAAADNALYKAKEKGRNRVEAA